MITAQYTLLALYPNGRKILLSGIKWKVNTEFGQWLVRVQIEWIR